MRIAFAALMISSLMVGCGSQRLSTGRGGVAPRVAGGHDTGWHRFSDREHHRALFPARGRIWSLTRTGVVSWDRGTATFRAERGPHAPGPSARTLAVADDGQVHVGLTDGLAWKDARGWHHSGVGFLSAGVTAMAPRVGGGVWVAGPSGLGWFHAGRLWIASVRYRVTDLARGAAGVVWAATEGHGVLALTANAITEHTVEHGLCGQRLKVVRGGADGRVAAVCQDGTFAVFSGSRWTPWRLSAGGRVQTVQPVRGGLAIQTSKGWLLAEPRPARGPNGRPTAALGPRLASIQAPRQPVPPLPSAPPPPPRHGSKRAPVPMPAPIVPPSVIEARLGITRAVARGVATKPGRWVIEPWPAPPVAGEVTASVIEADRGLWRAVSRRGLAWYRGDRMKHFASRSLVTQDGVTRLAEDRKGRLIWSDEHGNAWRWGGRSWMPLAVPGPGRLSAVEVDAIGTVWAALVVDPPPPSPMIRPMVPGPVSPGATPPTPGSAPAMAPPARPRPRVRVIRSTGDGPFEEVASVAVATDHRVLTGRLAVSPTGALYLPLFAVDGNNVRSALGLGRIPPSRDRLEIWAGQLGFDGEGADGEVVLPDSWVNDVATGPDGTVYVATNAGLLRRTARGSALFDENAFIDSEVILKVAVDPEGDAWVGTFEGLGRLRGDRWTPMRVPGLSAASIQAINIGHDGTVWVGTNKGLWAGKDDRWREVSVDGRTQTGPIRGVFADRKGDLWVATVQGLLHRPRRQGAGAP